jgi:type VI secretion system protein ImpE
MTTDLARSTTDSPPASPSLHDALRTRSFDELKQHAIDTIKRKPADTRERWLLFQLLCIDGEWERALKQLQTWASLEPAGTPRAQLYRGLIAAEMFRADVLAGIRRPGFIDPPPAWVDALLDANARLGANDIAAADALRATALNDAPRARGDGPETGAFQWLTDSDTRLGPICEMAVAGGYRWIPFDRLRSLTLTPVGTLTDLVWRAATVVLHDATVLKGYLPIRYPGSERAAPPLKLACETCWTDVGATHVLGLGQKTWTTDRGDWGLLDIGSCRFGADDGAD